MKISIAMATYNGGKYIGEQLQSLATQAHLPHELVICDDGSSDDTLQVVHEFAATAPFPVKVYENANRLNYSDNFIRAIMLCSGDWIALCDQDDVWRQDKLSLVAANIRPGVSMIVHPVAIVGEDLRPIEGKATTCRVKTGGEPFRLSLFGFFAGLGICFKRDIVSYINYRPRFPDRSNIEREAAHDQWISTLADAIGATKLLKQQLVLYRQHGRNTAGSWVATSHLLYSSTEINDYLRDAKLAEEIALCFSKMAEGECDKEKQLKLHQASIHYRLAKSYFQNRSILYQTKGRFERLKIWMKMTLGAAYKFNPGSHPILACAKDFFLIMRYR